MTDPIQPILDIIDAEIEKKAEERDEYLEAGHAEGTAECNGAIFSLQDVRYKVLRYGS